MTFHHRFILAGAAFFTLFLGNFAQAQDFPIKDQKTFDRLVQTYLMDNPHVIIDAVDAYRANAQKRERAKMEKAVKDNLKALTAKNLPSIGPNNADVTIVEFSDYNCGYCKKALPDLINLTKTDKNVRIVFHELPILSQDSRTSALWALAAHKQGKYFEYHTALMKYRGQKSENTLMRIARDVGLDEIQLKKDAASNAIRKQLQDSVSIAREIGISGTPAFIVGDQFFGGYIGPDGLKQAIAEARK